MRSIELIYRSRCSIRDAISSGNAGISTIMFWRRTTVCQPRQPAALESSHPPLPAGHTFGNDVTRVRSGNSVNRSLINDNSSLPPSSSSPTIAGQRRVTASKNAAGNPVVGASDLSPAPDRPSEWYARRKAPQRVSVQLLPSSPLLSGRWPTASARRRAPAHVNYSVGCAPCRRPGNATRYGRGWCRRVAADGMEKKVAGTLTRRRDVRRDRLQVLLNKDAHGATVASAKSSEPSPPPMPKAHTVDVGSNPYRPRSVFAGLNDLCSSGGVPDASSDSELANVAKYVGARA